MILKNTFQQKNENFGQRESQIFMLDIRTEFGNQEMFNVGDSLRGKGATQ